LLRAVSSGLHRRENAPNGGDTAVKPRAPRNSKIARRVEIGSSRVRTKIYTVDKYARLFTEECVRFFSVPEFFSDIAAIRFSDENYKRSVPRSSLGFCYVLRHGVCKVSTRVFAHAKLKTHCNRVRTEFSTLFQFYIIRIVRLLRHTYDIFRMTILKYLPIVNAYFILFLDILFVSLLVGAAVPGV